MPLAAVVTAEDAGFYKPRPEPYRALLERLGPGQALSVPELARQLWIGQARRRRASSSGRRAGGRSRLRRVSGLWAAVAAGMGVTPRTRVGMPGTVAPLGRRAGLPPLPRAPLTVPRSATAKRPGTARLAAILSGIASAEVDRANVR